MDEVKAPQFIIDIINSGYGLPFLAFPPAVCARNPKSAFEHVNFVSEAIQDLLIPAVLFACLPALRYVVLFRLWLMLRVNFV